jgi:hypothetical protein
MCKANAVGSGSGGRKLKWRVLGSRDRQTLSASIRTPNRSAKRWRAAVKTGLTVDAEALDLVVVVDVAWGRFVTAVSSTVGLLIANWLAPKA